ncbi:hypothetical protein FHS09_002004 [Microbulbifer rhizosphaerae]|uniref:Transposase n=1 Tax=Microbulbifer rhizosphaerae TaxID=1562603 RepID=A0A7W4WBE6_9GAMM|nr:hypothetical protein [Microbulbifer rhizosphaerae]
MAKSVALVVGEVLPEQLVRQWVLSFPFQLRFLCASRPTIMGRVLGIIYRVIATPDQESGADPRNSPHWRSHAGFDSALNLNIHFHMLSLDGVYVIRWVYQIPRGQGPHQCRVHPTRARHRSPCRPLTNI